MSTLHPSLKPPVPGAGPVDVTPEQLESLTGRRRGSAGTGPVPTMSPPGSAGTVGAALAEKVVLLYNEQTTLNQWLYFETTGWVKVGQASESGTLAMAGLGALARTLGVPAYADTGTSGQVETIYVW